MSQVVFSEKQTLRKYIEEHSSEPLQWGSEGFRVRQREQLGCAAITIKYDPRASGAGMALQSCRELGRWALAFLPLHRLAVGMQAALRKALCYWHGSFLQLKMVVGNWGLNTSVQKRVSG